MTVTSKLPASRKASKQVATASGDVARQARVEELRQMVAAGRYQVDPYKLALKIMVRALRRGVDY
jgi:anti-sigma28 factor (negative regulator of flagellin synthesis)